MNDLPDRADLLGALAYFLHADLRPKVDDPALAFRVRIAANLARMVSDELRGGDEHDRRARDRIEALFVSEPIPAPDASAPAPGEARPEHHAGAEAGSDPRAALTELDARLTEAIREGLFDAPEAAGRARRALLENLADKLKIVNPRFDPAVDLP